MAMRKYPRDPLALSRLWGELIGGPEDLMTEEELGQLPDDPFRYELLHGRLLRMLPPQERHGLIAAKLVSALGLFNQQHEMKGNIRAICGYLLSSEDEPDTVLAPDVSYLIPGRPAGMKKGAYRREAPDLAVEIASPSQFHPEMNEKAKIYMAAEVQLLWMVWPSMETVDVWRQGAQEPTTTLTVDDYLDGLDVLPGFHLPVAEIFALDED